MRKNNQEIEIKKGGDKKRKERKNYKNNRKRQKIVW